MSLVRGICFLFALSASPAVAAERFTTEQRNVLNHVAQVSAADVSCDDLEMNTAIINFLMIANKLDIRKSAVVDFMKEKAQGAMTGIEAVGQEIGCLVAYGLYGPGGQNVPDLLRRVDE